jgi:hypothetical protein
MGVAESGEDRGCRTALRREVAMSTPSSAFTHSDLRFAAGWLSGSRNKHLDGLIKLEEQWQAVRDLDHENGPIPESIKMVEELVPLLLDCEIGCGRLWACSVVPAEFYAANNPRRRLEYRLPFSK